MAGPTVAEEFEEDVFSEESTEDLSYSDLDIFPEFLLARASEITSLHLDHNEITILPRSIGTFHALVALDISNNGMTYLSPEIAILQKLRTLTARNNRFDNESLPKELSLMQSLKVVNFSGNRLNTFPIQFTKLRKLKSLHLGGNNIDFIPPDIGAMTRYVGRIKYCLTLISVTEFCANCAI